MDVKKNKEVANNNGIPQFAFAFDVVLMGVVAILMMDIVMQILDWYASSKGAHRSVMQFRSLLTKLLPLSLVVFAFRGKKDKLRLALVESIFGKVDGGVRSWFDTTIISALTVRRLFIIFSAVIGCVLGFVLANAEDVNREAIRSNLDSAGWVNAPVYREGGGSGTFYNVYHAPRHADPKKLSDWVMY